jgi:hypothetical protein
MVATVGNCSLYKPRASLLIFDKGYEKADDGSLAYENDDHPNVNTGGANVTHDIEATKEYKPYDWQ